MKRRAFTLIEALVIVAILVILWAILFPVFARTNHRDGKRAPCQNNLKHIGLGFRQYCQDHSEKYPIVAVGAAPFGWADALQDYVKSTQLLQCPTEVHPGSETPNVNGYTDYWYNRRLAHVSEAALNGVALTILIGDGNSGLDVTDARYSKDRLPPRWIQDTKSPAYRHLDGANYAFADGHVKWFKPNRISNSPVITDQSPTFAIR